MSETMQENMDAYGWFVGALDHPDKQVLLFRWMQSVTSEVRSLRMQIEQLEDRVRTMDEKLAKRVSLVDLLNNE